MTKISVIIPTGEKITADLVRFFEAYGKKYLVYTLNEKDEQGFVKLYVARIEQSNEVPGQGLIGEFIEDDNEWKSVKDEFKKIIGENNDNGSTSVNDLNPADLANINVRGHRVIKLMESYVNLLGANQKQFSAPAMPEFSASNVGENNFGYQAPASPFPEAPRYQAPTQPINANVAGNNFGYQAPTQPIPETPKYQAPTQPIDSIVPEFPTPSVGENNFSYQAPASPFPEAPAYQTPISPAPVGQTSASNYQEMYNELKAKYDRCNAELEKVTNENVELRIKIDDIKEILNGN